MIMRWILAFVFAFTPLQLAALEVRVYPADVVYPYEAEPARGFYTVVLQNVAVVQREGGAVTLDSLEVQAVSQGQVLQTLVIPAPDLDKSAQRLNAMEAQGVLKLYDFHFQTSRFLAEGVHMAASRKLDPGTAVLVTGTPLLLRGIPDQLALIAHGRDDSGKAVEARSTLKVQAYKSANEYTFPLTGTWYVAAAPSLESHHRWVVNEEFALDLGALGGNGQTHKGDGSKLDDYYDYGQDVLAVADGVVVEAVADAAEANGRLKQSGESAEDFMKRTIVEQNKLLARGAKTALGNFIVIQHAGGEFSDYAHLRQGSVKVKAGDKVIRGQVIAQLGHTGNTTEPHLHFQLTDGPDPMYSRGLPIVFRNTSIVALDEFDGRQLQTGWIVTAAPVQK
jgi:murein DD-endopeptidase MepM/ murein hydrolase activator NlpD